MNRPTHVQRRLEPDDPRHGTTRGHYLGCRCDPCKRARSRYEKATKHRRRNGVSWAIDVTGTQRRIRALMTLGYTSTDLASELGWNDRNDVLRILYGQKGKPARWVERKTYKAVHDLYERLCMTPPEMTPYRKRARTLALRKGYQPPLAWDDIDDPTERPKGVVTTKQADEVDEVAVQRALNGDYRIPLTRAERLELVRRWRAAGRTLTSLEQATGWNVSRYVRELQKEVA